MNKIILILTWTIYLLLAYLVLSAKSEEQQSPPTQIKNPICIFLNGIY